MKLLRTLQTQKCLILFSLNGGQDKDSVKRVKVYSDKTYMVKEDALTYIFNLIMNCHSTILVYDLQGSAIHTREASSVIMHLVQNDPCDHIELDFSSIDYISRSFADQFYLEKMDYAIKLDRTIIVSNASVAVTNMLHAVAKSQNETNRKTEKAPVYQYSSQGQLENFLLSF